MNDDSFAKQPSDEYHHHNSTNSNIHNNIDNIDGSLRSHTLTQQLSNLLARCLSLSPTNAARLSSLLWFLRGVIALTAAITCWLGLWNLYDRYIFPPGVLWELFQAVMGIVILILTNTLSQQALVDTVDDARARTSSGVTVNSNINRKSNTIVNNDYPSNVASMLNDEIALTTLPTTTANTNTNTNTNSDNINAIGTSPPALEELHPEHMGVIPPCCRNRVCLLFIFFIRALLSLAAVVLVWKGIWNFLDLYVASSESALREVLFALIGTFVLVITGTFYNNAGVVPPAYLRRQGGHRGVEEQGEDALKMLTNGRSPMAYFS